MTIQIKDFAILAAVAVVGAIGGIVLDRVVLRPAPTPALSPDLAGVVEVDAQGRPGFDLKNLTIPKKQLKRGGPRKDGIPALVNPKVTDTDGAGFVADTDRVVAVTVNEATRLYPLRILNWHEIANDVIAGRPIAVVYCPLCDSVSVFDRRVGEQTLEFGVSGLLYNSNVLLYDRTHHALWSQLKLQAISGLMIGQRLVHLPFDLISFGEAKQHYPDSTIVTLDTGHDRAYDRNPYENYFKSDRLMFRVKSKDDRLSRKARIIGILGGPKPIAVPLATIQQAGGEIKLAAGTQHIILKSEPDTDSVRIEQLPTTHRAVHTFWFSWAAMHPNTEIYPNQNAP